jgi:hypothetical protein
MIGIEEKDTALRAMAGVAGGCWRRDLCGAISGAAMVIGSLFARADLQEVEDPRSIPTIALLYDRLRELAVNKYGDTRCQTISRCNWYDPEDVKARRTDGRRDPFSVIIVTGHRTSIRGSFRFSTKSLNDCHLLSSRGLGFLSSRIL